MMTFLYSVRRKLTYYLHRGLYCFFPVAGAKLSFSNTLFNTAAAASVSQVLRGPAHEHLPAARPPRAEVSHVRLARTLRLSQNALLRSPAGSGTARGQPWELPE